VPELLGWTHDFNTATPFDYFLFFLPITYFISVILFNTNQMIELSLGPSGKKVTMGELLVFIGVFVYMMVYPFQGSRRDYFEREDSDDCFPAPRLNRYMGRARFELILKCLRVVPDTCYNNLGDPLRHTRDFIDTLNQHMLRQFKPGPVLTIDESMIAGFSWFLTCVTVILRKPRPVGHELKTLCCSLTYICCRVEVQEGKEHMAIKPYRTVFAAAIACTLRLCDPFKSTYRIIVGDSWFGSVATAVALYTVLGLYCVLNVKTGHTNFPKQRLTKRHTGERGTHVSAVGKHAEHDCELLACTWLDKTLFHLVGTWGTTEAASERVRASGRLVPRPHIHEQYLTNFNAIDIFNKLRHGGIGMEDVWRSKTAWHRMFAGLLGFIITNAYLAYAWFTQSEEKLGHNQFLQVLARQLLTNTYDQRNLRRPSRASLAPGDFHTAVSFMKTRGKLSKPHCILCRSRISTYCAGCGEHVGICSPANTGRNCLVEHAADPEKRRARKTRQKKRRRV